MGHAPRQFERRFAPLARAARRALVVLPMLLAASAVRAEDGSPNEPFALSLEHQQLLFEPGETLAFDVTFDLPGIGAGSPFDFGVRVTPARGGDPSFELPSQRLAGSVEGALKQRVDFALPREEGVYVIRLTAMKPAGLRDAFFPLKQNKPIAQREFQVVVFDPNRAVSVAGDWTEVLSIDPTSKHWWRRMPDWVWIRRAPWLPKGPLGSTPANIQSGASGPHVRLPATTDGESPAWQAYPMPIGSPGSPFVVEVEYPADAPQQLAISVFDQHRGGGAGPLGATLGVTLSEELTAEGKQLKARKLFWPNTSSPLVVISNGDPSRPAAYSRIRVYRASDPAPAEDSAKQRKAENREVLARFSSANFPFELGLRVPSAEPEQPADWQLGYQAASRLGDAVELGHQSGAMVPVAAPGGIGYPSTVLPQFSTASDLPQQDLLELVFREFDRRGLSFTPSLSLDQIASDGSAETEQGCLLDPQTRERLIAAVEELTARYGHHPSLAGVAIDLGGGSRVSLPGDDWAPPPRLVEQFLATRGLAWPATTPRTPQTMLRQLRGPWATPWREFRIEATTQLWSEVAKAVNRGGEDRQLVLLLDSLLTTGQFAQTLTPRLGREASVADALVGVGIDLKTLRAESDVVVPTPRYQTFGDLLADEAIAIEMNRSLPIAGAALLASRGRRQQLTSLEQASPFGEGATDGQLQVVPVAAGAGIAEPHVSLAAGGAPGLVLEASAALALDDRLLVARDRLSAAAPADLPAKVAGRQPLVVRAVTLEGSANETPHDVIELANPSPWPVEAQVTVRTAKPCRMQKESDAPVLCDEGDHALSVSLGPFTTEVLRFDTVGVEPIGVRTQVAEVARTTLAEQVASLRRRDLNATRKFSGCTNPSFENLAADGSLAAWQAIQSDHAGAIALSETSPADGKRSLKLSSRGGATTVESHPMPSPSTGQLALVFFTRPAASDEAVSPELRIVVKATEGDYQSATVISPDLFATQLEEWRAYVLSVDDLPLASDQRIQIRFELRGAGTVEVDRLEMYDLLFPLEFLGNESDKQRLALLRTIHSAEKALEAGRLTDCREILAGYWPRFLQTHTPLVEPQAPPQVATRHSVAPKAKTEAAEEPEEDAGWRGYLPGFLR